MGNAIMVDILILEQNDNACELKLLKPLSSTKDCTTLILCKTGQHYDAILPIMKVKTTECEKSYAKTTHNLQSKYVQKTKQQQGMALKIAHINVRSLRKKVEQLKVVVKKYSIDILCISESWLQDTITDGDVAIEDFSIVRRDRRNRTRGGGGGVAIYVKNGIMYSRRNDIITDPDLESVWLEVKTSCQPILVCCMYRAPGSLSIVYDHIIDTFENASKKDEHMVILGDLNHDYLSNQGEPNNKIVIIESLFGMKQLIEEPTRITTKSSTLLDIILTNRPNKHDSSGVQKVTMSDHYMTWTSISVILDRVAHKQIRFRNYKCTVKEKCLDDCRNTFANFNHTRSVQMKNEGNVEEIWQIWSQKFLEMSDRHAPFKIQRVKERKNQWITQNIIRKMTDRDKKHHQAISCKHVEQCTALWNQYRRLRNGITNEIRQLKRQHYHKVIHMHAKNPKEMWKAINTVLPKPGKDSVTTSITPDEFNDYFSIIGHNVVCSNITVNDEYKWKLPESIYIQILKNFSGRCV